MGNSCMHYSKKALAPIASLVSIFYSSLVWLVTKTRSSAGKGILLSISPLFSVSSLLIIGSLVFYLSLTLSCCSISLFLYFCCLDLFWIWISVITFSSWSLLIIFFIFPVPPKSIHTPRTFIQFCQIATKIFNCVLMKCCMVGLHGKAKGRGFMCFFFIIY